MSLISEQLPPEHPCVRCGDQLCDTYWHLQGRHYCEPCADFTRLAVRQARITDLVWERLPNGEFAWLRAS
jgi:hypothetical protein